MDEAAPTGIRRLPAALAHWLSARATLLLVLLMVQLALLLAFGEVLFRASPAASAGIASRGARAACGAYEVVFAPQAGFAALRQWALNFDAQVVGGPNSRGAMELAVPQLDLASLREALGPLASEVRANPLCPPEAAP